MKKNQRQYRRAGGLWTLLFALFIGLVGCEEDEMKGEPFFELGEPSLQISNVASSYRLIIYSNQRWKVVTEESADWLEVYPLVGEDDGAVTITIQPKTDAGMRTTTLRIVSVDHPEVTAAFPIEQSGQKAYILLPAPELNVSPKDGNLLLAVTANVEWEATVENTPDWIRVTKKDNQSLEISSDKNESGADRSARILFRDVAGDPDADTVLVVKQIQYSSDFEAPVKTIAALLSEGNITDNLTLEAWVTSDPQGKNLPEDEVVIEDESGKGLRIKLNSPADAASFKLNDKITLFVSASAATLESTTEGTWLAGISGSNVILAQSSQGLAPVVKSIAEIDGSYLNRLVTLKSVEFTNPFGTYFNVGEKESKFDETKHNRCHLLLKDQAGDVMKLWTSLNCTYKHHMLPLGAGDLTGIIVKEGEEYGIRTRQLADVALAAERGNNTWMPVVEWLFDMDVNTQEEADVKLLKTNAGSGSICTNLKSNPATAQAEGLYSYNDFCRREADQSYVKALGALTSAGFNTVGSYWEIRTSTKGYTGDIALSYSSFSSVSGPRDFKVEWADASDLSNWHKVAEYAAWNRETYMYLNNYNYVLDGAANKEEIVIRLTVTSTMRADGKNNVAAGGTNSLGYVAVTHKAK